MSKQKTTLVTGGNKGIGFEICHQLAARGFLVFLTARKPEAGLQAAATLKKQKAQVQFIQMDVTSPESISLAAKEVGKATDHLDVLVNNAAILVENDRNVLGPLRVAQAFWPLLAKSEGGRVINISSGAGALNDMEDYAPAYSISKTALNALTRQLAAALKTKGIAVNSVTPGWVRTDMGGPTAPRTVEEGAAGPVWLATEAPQELTGQFIRDRQAIAW